MTFKFSIFVIFSFVVLSSLSLVLSVDRSKFRTCEQTGFCKRNRNLQEGSSQHFLRASSIQVSSSSFSAELHHPSFEANPLILTVSCYQNGIFRTSIDEKHSNIKKRWHIQEVLMERVLSSTLKVKSQTSEHVILSCDTSTTNELKIEFQPLKIEALQNGNPVIVANDRGLFNFEHYRSKPEPPEIPSPAEQKVEGENSEESETKEEETTPKQSVSQIPDDGSWEESFGSHRDTKPFGPSSIGLDFTFVDSKNVYGILLIESSFLHNFFFFLKKRYS